MITFAFFTAVFLTCSWLIFSILYISDKLHGITLSMLGSMDLLIYTVITLLPILVIWMIFSHANNYIHNRFNGKKMRGLLEQMKRNQDYSDLIARVLIESEQTIKSGFVISKIDFFISEINEIISEILKLTGSTDEQLQDIWFRVNNGEKWLLGKTFIEKADSEANYIKDISRMIRFDNPLAAVIYRFNINYKNITNILEKHDKENFFQNIIETGVLGKISTILSPMSDAVKDKEEVQSIVIEPKIEFKTEVKPVKEEKVKPIEIDTEQKDAQEESNKTNWLSKLINRNKNKEEDTYNDVEKETPSIINKDSFYMFLENHKSSGKEETFIRKEPVLSASRSFLDEDDEG